MQWCSEKPCASELLLGRPDSGPTVITTPGKERQTMLTFLFVSETSVPDFTSHPWVKEINTCKLVNHVVWLTKVRVVPKSTVVSDSDWRFDNLSRSHRQSQDKSCLSVECNKSGSWKLMGQYCCDVICCKTQVAFVRCDWSVAIRWYKARSFCSAY